MVKRCLKKIENVLRGDVSGLRGDVTGLRGYVTNLSGNVDDAGLTDADRKKGVNVQDLVKAGGSHG